MINASDLESDVCVSVLLRKVVEGGIILLSYRWLEMLEYVRLIDALEVLQTL